MDGARRGGLNATELSLVIAELQAEVLGSEVRDVARLRDADDLLLFVSRDDERRAVHIAPGGTRARACLTRRRFRRDQFATGPRVDRLRQTLVGLTILGIEQPDGERCGSVVFGSADTASHRLEFELFGARGLWCLVDADGVILELSRLPTTKNRTVAPGEVYRPPLPHPTTTPPESRFAAPVNEQVDGHFTALDLEAEGEKERGRLQQTIQRAIKKLDHRIQGLEAQKESIGRIPEIRRAADMMLAYAFQAKRGDTELVVPDPDDPERELRLELDPAVPVANQAEALYKRARKLEKSAEMSDRDRSAAIAKRDELAGLAEELEREPEDLGPIDEALERLGLAPKRSTKKRAQAKPTAEGHRRFASAEGFAILVGRNNQDNDRLSLRTGRGNDLWLHVGAGYAGSHVVIRLPRGKVASLESLLDAGTLAIHFSKARGNPRCDVIYTQCKHVRKPKGLPAGAVVPTQTKTITVRAEPARLKRLLDSLES